jgi:hypothetical protein
MYNRYQNTQTIRLDKTGKTYYLNNVYSDIPVVEGDNYVITTLGDRLDLMSLDFYGDVSYWWVIALANSLPGDSLYPPIGMQLRIPIDIKGIINAFNQVNANR